MKFPAKMYAALNEHELDYLKERFYADADAAYFLDPFYRPNKN